MSEKTGIASRARRLLLLLVLGAAVASAAAFQPAREPGPREPIEDLFVSDQPPGRAGGRLVVALRSEPKTLNPVLAADGSSRDIIGRMTADLIHVNRLSHLTEPALAPSWSVSPDGRQYTLRLRKGIRFSDGHPFDADDVVFTFRVLLDEQVRAPQRDLLLLRGKPITAEKLDAYTVRFTLADPYAAAERLFDSIAILPRHLLEPIHAAGRLPTAWTLGSNRAEIAGLGPFRLKQYVPGERLVLERNPYYWKVDRAGNRLPYLDELVFVFVPNEDAQLLRFQSGDSHLLNRISTENYAVLLRDRDAKGYQLHDLGPGVEYNFLLFNLNDLASKSLPEIAARQRWFGETSFRRAVSLGIDRDAIVRLAYQGRAAALWGNVSPGNRLWVNPAIPRPARAPDRARALLRSAGFAYRGDTLVDSAGRAVEFSIIVSSSSPQRVKMATIVQNDLAELGMRVHVVPLESRALVDRVFQTWDYEACMLGLAGGDGDPNSEMNVWLSRGTSHLWSLGQTRPESAWEAEIDTLMEQQLVTLDYRRRKELYDRVQQLIAEHLPLIFLASPSVLVAARREVGNFRPAVLDHQTLWNVEELFLRSTVISSR